MSDRPTARLDSTPLGVIEPHSTKKPKGFAAYKPKGKTIPTVARIVELYERMRQADALPLGPRQVNYRLKELFPGEYTKDDRKAIEEIVKRLGQAETIPFDWIADAASVTHEPVGWDGPEDFLEGAHNLYRRDRRAGQPVVVEIYTEAKETLGLINRVAGEQGVTVYSASGSGGPRAAYRVASRALQRAVQHGQRTLILGICDFDDAGIRNILRPHIEHVSAFLYGTAGQNEVMGETNGDGRLVTIFETASSAKPLAGLAVASFQHLALTPEMALNLVETEVDRNRIEAYIASGRDLWDRDLDLIAGVQKIELEALDPPDLRDLVVAAIEDVLAGEVLKDLVREEESEREALREFIATGRAAA